MAVKKEKKVAGAGGKKKIAPQQRFLSLLLVGLADVLGLDLEQARDNPKVQDLLAAARKAVWPEESSEPTSCLLCVLDDSECTKRLGPVSARCDAAWTAD